MADPILIQGVANRAQPGSYSNNAQVPARASSYGELVMQPLAGSKMHALTDEGAYFLCRNATPGTGIAGHAAPTTIDDEKPLVFIRNTASPSAKTRLYLDYIRLQVTAAGADGTTVRAACMVDKGNSRRGTGGTDLTPINPNMDSSESSVATVAVGAVAASAESADVRLLNHGLLRPVITVVGDCYFFDFGGSSKVPSSMIVAGTAVANIVVPCAPVVIGPEQMFLLHMAAASQSAACSYEVEIGYWER